MYGTRFCVYLNIYMVSMMLRPAVFVGQKIVFFGRSSMLSIIYSSSQSWASIRRADIIRCYRNWNIFYESKFLSCESHQDKANIIMQDQILSCRSHFFQCEQILSCGKNYLKIISYWSLHHLIILCWKVKRKKSIMFNSAVLMCDFFFLGWYYWNPYCATVALFCNEQRELAIPDPELLHSMKLKEGQQGRCCLGLMSSNFWENSKRKKNLKLTETKDASLGFPPSDVLYVQHSRSGGQNDDFRPLRPLTYTPRERGTGCRDKYVTSWDPS